ncbi:S-Ena type endospore appendage [Rossellomorea sp. NPDC077527]|uniref:S-Ena type endospore appendage n=1 Tax=Rossellomorea sp. NPDC077527 TaxID=3364510 RepID=UPI0037C75D14
MMKHEYSSCDMKRNWTHEKESCPDRVKGFNLCKKRNELRCFKQCQPISQPCSSASADPLPYFNYFTSRTNFEFSGLVVVTNSGNPTSGCSMRVRVTDRAGGGSSQVVANVSPGASVPIFVEGLISLDIACISADSELPVPTTCSGEVIFDLEYCATKVCL